jgi:hypothetical protein
MSVFGSSKKLLMGAAGASGGLAPFTGYNFTDRAVIASGTTFSSVDFGTAASDRNIIVFVVTWDGAVTGMTIGGVTATEISGDVFSDFAIHCNAFYASVPTGTTGNIVLTTTNTAESGIIVYNAFGGSLKNHDTFFSSGNPTIDISLNVDASDAVMAMATNANSVNSITWTGVTADPGTPLDMRSDEYIYSGSDTASTSETPRTVTAVISTGSQARGISVAWG